MAKPGISNETKQAICQLGRDGYDADQIAVRFGIHRDTVRKIACNHGVKLRHRPRVRKSFPDLAGQTFSYLTVIAQAPGPRFAWICKCRCGGSRIVSPCLLLSGAATSCGCHQRKGPNKGHGLSRLPEYRVWAEMIQRCTNPKSRVFRHYGGRGIRVCESWRTSFEAFYRDMGSRPTDKHSIDRINNDGNYEPSNCRWATQSQQLYNRRPRQRKVLREAASL